MLRPVVVDRLVQGAAVVPERDRPGPPAETTDKLGTDAVFVEVFEQLFALVRRQADNVRGEQAVDEQALAPADRVNAHQRMLDRWVVDQGLSEALATARPGSPGSRARS